MYDAIVVGARCAGAATAMLLARRGHRVLLVDRSTFPSDMRMSNHLLWPPGGAALQRWGLLDELIATGCPPMATGTMDLGAFRLTGRFVPADGVATAYAPRRRILDGLLVEAATKAGAVLWDGCTVHALQSDGTRVTGIRGRTRDGRAVAARGTIVVGADGMHSRVARMAQAPAYHERAARQGVYLTYWSGVPVSAEPTLYSRPRRSVVAFPTHDDLTVVSVTWPLEEFRAARSAIEGNYLAEVAAAAPELAEKLRTGTREEPFVGAAVPGFFRRAHGEGWALVGDAGYLKDPCTAQGMTDAFQHAERLTDAIDIGLRDPAAMTGALADYQRRRDASVMAMYEFTCAQTGFEPPSPQMQELIGALRDDPDGTDRFLSVFAGTVPVQEFFAAADPAAA
jgi:2-polyprenyl-6-methoxyphenol hydroxylase-like FAD-dependent oxidoreductase